MNRFVPFDSILARVLDLLEAPEALPAGIPDLYLVRDLYGKVRLSIADSTARDNAARDGLERLAAELHRALGVHAYPPEEALLLVDEALLTPLKDTAREIRPACTGSNAW